jgi:hypothetical protein
MSSANGPEPTPSPDAEADARDADAFFGHAGLISTTSNLRLLAELPLWRTAKFSVPADVTAIRQALRTCQQSLNLIESELDKRE